MAFDRRRLAPDDPRLAEARARRASGETYEAIGLAIGVKGSTVHRWLNGEAPQRREQVRNAVAKTVRARREMGLCIDCGERATATARYCDRCAEASRTRKRALHRRQRAAALAAYGGVCSCCGESEERFLTIDHVNDDGADHRRIIGNTALYRWLAREGFPDGFTVLCFNCNCGRFLNGGVCPHEQEGGEVRHLRVV